MNHKCYEHLKIRQKSDSSFFFYNSYLFPNVIKYRVYSSPVIKKHPRKRKIHPKFFLNFKKIFSKLIFFFTSLIFEKKTKSRFVLLDLINNRNTDTSNTKKISTTLKYWLFDYNIQYLYETYINNFLK